jgi:hypothetical protein
MSFHVTFDLDELTPLRFQELCNVLLLNFFSQMITPMVRTGRDGQMDGKLEGLPVNYSDLINAPFAYKAPDGSDSYWVFQCKHTQREKDTDRDKDAIRALKREIDSWKEKKRRPTHCIFMTNVNLKASSIVEIDAIGKTAFGFFDLWHEPKIAGFVANNVALQKTFYPARSTSLDIHVVDLKALAVSAPAAASPLSPAALGPPEDAIRTLALYEIAFLTTNASFLETLKVSTERRELPPDWKRCAIRSKCKGVLALAADQTSLRWVADKIATNSLHVTLWSRFLGESTEPNEEIATLAYDPDIESDLLLHIDRIFECTEGQNDAHVAVDRYLRGLESSILSDVKANKIQDARDGLYALLHARTDYTKFKSDNPEASYPNMRRWGRTPIFGWDFVGLWEDVLKNVCDVVFSGQYPESVYDLLIYSSFHLSVDAIRSKRPVKSFQTELFTLRVVFWVIVKKRRSEQLEGFLDKLEDLAQAVSDLDHQTKSVPDAEWALDISKEVAAYIGEMGFLTLSGKAPLSIDKLSHVLALATSLDFTGLVSGGNDLGVDYGTTLSVQSDLVRKLGLVQKEYLFAWATFSWHQERIAGTDDPGFARSLLSHLEMGEIVSLYTKNSKGDSHGWIESWFRPEGKRTSWSWTFDHDVRDILLLSVISFPIKKEDFENLDLFQIESSYDDFVRQLAELHGRLAAKGKVVSDLSTVVPIVSAAQQFHREKFNDSIRAQTILSQKKLDEVMTSFQKSIAEHNREGSLYTVDETLDVQGLSPTHYVGQYSIEDKVWFLDDTGRSYYSITGRGGDWAENVLSGRIHLLVTKAREIAQRVEYEPGRLTDVLSEIQRVGRNERILLLSPMTIPWKIASAAFTNVPELESRGEPRVPGRSGRLGEVDVFYVRFLKRGELLIAPRRAFSWTIRKRAERPVIETIREDSDDAKKIQERNAGMDLRLKVLVEAREVGIMNYKETEPAPTLYFPRTASPEPDTEE